LDVFSSFSSRAVREYDWSEIMLHNNETKGYWMVIDDKVLDVTKFRYLHPGGAVIILAYCGIDATQAYNAVGHSGNPQIEAMKMMTLIGEVRRLRFPRNLTNLTVSVTSTPVSTSMPSLNLSLSKFASKASTNSQEKAPPSLMAQLKRQRTMKKNTVFQAYEYEDDEDDDELRAIRMKENKETQTEFELASLFEGWIRLVHLVMDIFNCTRNEATFQNKRIAGSDDNPVDKPGVHALYRTQFFVETVFRFASPNLARIIYQFQSLVGLTGKFLPVTNLVLATDMLHKSEDATHANSFLEHIIQNFLTHRRKPQADKFFHNFCVDWQTLNFKLLNDILCQLRPGLQEFEKHEGLVISNPQSSQHLVQCLRSVLDLFAQYFAALVEKKKLVEAFIAQ